MARTKQFMLGALGVLAAGLLSSCVVTDGYVSSGYNSGYSSHATAGIPVGLIRTSSANWYYDPYRRSYYDLKRQAYYNHLNRSYCRSTPRRYNTCSYPYNWNRVGTCPGPRSYNNYHRSSSNVYQSRTPVVVHNTRGYNQNRYGHSPHPSQCQKSSRNVYHNNSSHNGSHRNRSYERHSGGGAMSRAFGGNNGNSQMSSKMKAMIQNRM